MAADIIAPLDRSFFGPDWRDLLRHPSGTRLKLELALSTAMRQAIESVRTSSAGRWLRLLDGATLVVERSSGAGCDVRLENASGVRGRFTATGTGESGYALCGSLRMGEVARDFNCRAVRVQTGGTMDAYLAQAIAGEWRHLVRLSYRGSEPGAVDVFVCAAALGGRTTPALRAVLPAQLLVARLLPRG